MELFFRNSFCVFIESFGWNLLCLVSLGTFCGGSLLEKIGLLGQMIKSNKSGENIGKNTGNNYRGSISRGQPASQVHSYNLVEID